MTALTTSWMGCDKIVELQEPKTRPGFIFAFIPMLFTLPTYIYIFLLFYFTTHLIMTEARSKRRVLPLIFIVKSFTKSLLIFPCFQRINRVYSRI